MNLREMKQAVVAKVKSECGGLNINLDALLSKITEVMNILISADSKENAAVNNGLQDLDEFNFDFALRSSDKPVFVIELGTIYSPVSIKSGGGKFICKLFSIADHVYVETRNEVVFIGLEFNLY